MIKKNRSATYIATVDPAIESDNQWLVWTKQMVAESNKASRKNGSSARLRIELKGRLGKNNSNRHKYRKNTNGNGYRVKLEDAAFIDVYIIRVRK